jgi:hypothetical protein
MLPLQSTRAISQQPKEDRSPMTIAKKSVARPAAVCSDVLRAVPGTEHYFFGYGTTRPSDEGTAHLIRLAELRGCEFVQAGEGIEYAHAFAVRRDVADKFDGYAVDVLIDAANAGLFEAQSYDSAAASIIVSLSGLTRQPRSARLARCESSSWCGG